MLLCNLEGESLRRVWIVVAGVLALMMAVALAVLGAHPNGGYLWIHSIQNALSASVAHPTGGYLWIH